MTEVLTGIMRLAVLVFLLSGMSGIGLGLTLQQIVAPLRNARFVLLALLANFILAPLLAVGIARLLRLDEPFALGLLLLGLAAGAPFMPKIVSVQNFKDPNVSVMVLVATLASVLTLVPAARLMGKRALVASPENNIIGSH